MIDQTQLSHAFYRVKLVADQTWWSEKDYSDKYKLASLGLWNEFIYSNERLVHFDSAGEHNANKLNNCQTIKMNDKQLYIGNKVLLKKSQPMQKAITIMDAALPAPLPQSAITDTRCILSTNWPQVLLKAYPAFSNTLNDCSSRSIFSHKHTIAGGCKGFNTLPFSIDSVEEQIYLKKVASQSVRNVWVNEPQKKFFEKSNEIKSSSWQRGLNANVPEFYPSVLLPPRQCPPRYSNVFGANYQSEVFPYNEDKLQVTSSTENVAGNYHRKNCRGSSEPKHSSPSAGAPSSDLMIAGTADWKHIGNPFADTTAWLQNVYPFRISELSKIAAFVRQLETIKSQIPSNFPQVAQESVAKAKCEVEQNPFDELERQALEQYQSSETCLFHANNESQTDAEDSKFQDLEREALEQYVEDKDDHYDDSVHPVGPFLPSEVTRAPFLSTTSSSSLANYEIGCAERKSQLSQDGSETIALESIVNSVVYKKNFYYKHENKILPSSQIKRQDEALKKSGRLKKNGKKSKTPLDDIFFRQDTNAKQHWKETKSVGRCFAPVQPAVSTEDDIRHIATDLKHKVLNYLRSVDLKIVDAHRKLTLKQQLFKETCTKPIQERVRVTDIKSLEIYKCYVKEFSSKSKTTLLLHFKRIRSDIMESTSRGMIILISPTTSEKRQVRRIIKKCLELKAQADCINLIQRSPLLYAIRREVHEVLETVHHTMEVIYTLRNLSKSALKDVEYVRNRGSLALDLSLGNSTLDDSSDYLRQKVMIEERAVLLVLLFPRVSGLLYDRNLVLLHKIDSHFIYCDHDMLRLNYELLLRNYNKVTSLGCAVESIFYQADRNVMLCNMFLFRRMEHRGMWDSKNWSHILEIGKQKRRVALNLCSTARQAEAASCVVRFKLPTLKMLLQQFVN